MYKSVYEECPTYRKELITLRKTMKADLEDLLKCYSDEKAVPLFNSDNCHGDNFYYPIIEKIRQAMDFFEQSYSYIIRFAQNLAWIINKMEAEEV